MSQHDRVNLSSNNPIRTHASDRYFNGNLNKLISWSKIENDISKMSSTLFRPQWLTHWGLGRCEVSSNWVIIGTGKGLLAVKHQALAWSYRLAYCHLNTQQQISLQFEPNYKVFFHEHAFQKLSAKFWTSKGKWVNQMIQLHDVNLNKVLHLFLIFIMVLGNFY